MSKKILVSTIVRDRNRFLPRWAAQLSKLCSLKSDYTFYLSVYENDSKDGSQETLNSLSFEGFKDVSIISETLGTRSFGSVRNDLRVKLLAEARNKSLYENSDRKSVV